MACRVPEALNGHVLLLFNWTTRNILLLYKDTIIKENVHQTNMEQMQTAHPH